jgi:hypothetical protein
MKQDYHKGESENEQTEPVQPNILIGTDYVRIADHDGVHKSTLAFLQALKFIECMQKPGVFGMTFRAILYCFRLGKDLMGDKYGIIDFRMALDATDGPEVGYLIG